MKQSEIRLEAVNGKDVKAPSKPKSEMNCCCRTEVE
jgi:hypothetical protein